MRSTAHLILESFDSMVTNHLMFEQNEIKLATANEINDSTEAY